VCYNAIHRYDVQAVVVAKDWRSLPPRLEPGLVRQADTERSSRPNESIRLTERAPLCRALCPIRHLRTETTQHTATADDRGASSFVTVTWA
jgi:hypothetical protein